MNGIRKKIIVLGMLAVAGCATFRFSLSEKVDVKMGVPFELQKRNAVANQPMYPHLRRLFDGRLVVMSPLGQIISSDNGATWTPLAERDLALDPLIDGKDDVILDRMNNPSPVGGVAVWNIFSVKEGRVTGEKQSAVLRGMPALASNAVMLGTEFLSGMYFWPNERGVMLADGTILLTAYTRFVEDGKCRTLLIRSRDRGHSFEYAGTVATAKDASWGLEGPSESALAVLKDGSLLCVMRVGNELRQAGQMLLQAQSFDGGNSWTNHHGISFYGVNPMLAVLENGVIVLGAGRPGNNVIFSTDNARTWSAERAVSSPEVKSQGYLDIIPVGPDKVFIVYELDGTQQQKLWLWEPPPPQDLVMGVFVEVSPL